MIKLSPSTLAYPESEVVNKLHMMQDLNVDYIHCDVLRDDFVSTNVLSLDTLKDIRNHTSLPLDVHIMSKDVWSILNDVCDLKCNIITVHFEAFESVDKLKNVLATIRKSHSYAGLAINPMTNADKIFDLLPYVDVVLVMGVVPGKSGQKMISNTCPKVKELRSYIYKNKLDTRIEVDGGVNMDNIGDLADAGVDIVVMGKAFAETSDRNKPALIKNLHKM